MIYGHVADIVSAAGCLQDVLNCIFFLLVHSMPMSEPQTESARSRAVHYSVLFMRKMWRG